MIMAWYSWHDCIGTSLVIYFHVWFQIRGTLSNQGQTSSRVQAFWTLYDFFPALDYNGYSYKQLLYRTIKVFQQTLSNMVTHAFFLRRNSLFFNLKIIICFRHRLFFYLQQSCVDGYDHRAN